MSINIKDAFNFAAEVVFKPLGDEKGEDAFAYSFTRDNIHAQAIFDGSGGAGSWKYPEFRNATGAFVAAQSMSAIFMEWIDTLTEQECSTPQMLAEHLQDETAKALRILKENCAPMGVSGSMVRSFPCTGTAAVITRRDEKTLRVTSLNCGDSRVYFMTPKTGLVQMTADDSRGCPDALESLRESAPLSDMMNADKPFRIKFRDTFLELPCAVLCASDGAFGYLESPMHFEYLVLKTLLEADAPAGFEERLKKELSAVTGDDTTCIFSFYGWPSFAELQHSFGKRLEEVKGLLAQLEETKTPEERMEALERVWQEYKKQTVFDLMQG